MESENEVFLTPRQEEFSSQRSPSPSKLSPSKSLFKRGILLSSIKNLTPPRPGFWSPQRGSFTDVNRSARRRAVKTAYDRLMDDGSDDELSLREQLLTEQIIQASRNEALGESEDEVLSEEDLTTKKRGRGRPRKEDQSVQRLPTSVASSGKKRGRGRPRKSEQVSQLSNEVEDDGTVAALLQERSSETPSIEILDIKKRGRGRPRKSEIRLEEPNESIDDSLNEPSEDDGAGGNSEEEPKIKRGRGRPKKVPQLEQGENEGEIASDKEPIIKKRGRGRPRKIDSQLKEHIEDSNEKSDEVDAGDSPETEQSMKRGRGPRKEYRLEQEEDDDDDSRPSSSDEEFPVKKRGRGRPRKDGQLHQKQVTAQENHFPLLAGEQIIKKRGRGRPRKIDQSLIPRFEEYGDMYEATDSSSLVDSPRKNRTPIKSLMSEEATPMTLNFRSSPKPRTPRSFIGLSGSPSTSNRKTILEMDSDEDELEQLKSAGPKKKLDFLPAPIPAHDDFTGITSKFDDHSLYLDGSEGYFEQHKSKGRLSGNTMAQAPSVDYEEFIPLAKLSKLVNYKQRMELLNSHKQLYQQWIFELTEGYSLNFYGIGSKREVIMEFVNEYLLDWRNLPTLVINGYNPSVSLKAIISDIVSAFLSKKQARKIPRNPVEAVPVLMNFISSKRKKRAEPKLLLVIHNIDGAALRDDKTQEFLSQLCSLQEIYLISSTDHFNAALLWDSNKSSLYNFIWHDLTTYENYTVESSFKDVLSLGKSRKFVGTKGASYVLTSLTSNARNLYRILLSKELEMMEEKNGAAVAQNTKGTIKHGIEFKALYTACLEEFVTSNEISFRTMLGEFIEHKMASLIRDPSGLEMVFIPFTYGEMKNLLDEGSTG